MYLRLAEIFGMCCGWIVYPPKIYWSPNTRYLGMWPYLDIKVFPDVLKLRHGHLGLNWALNPKTSYFIRKEKLEHRHTPTCDDDGGERGCNDMGR